MISCIVANCWKIAFHLQIDQTQSHVMLNEPLLAFLKAILVLYSYTKDKYVLLKSLLAINTLTLRLMIKVLDDVTEKRKQKLNSLG